MRPSTAAFLVRFAIVVAVAIPLGFMLEDSDLPSFVKWILGFLGAGIGGAWANRPVGVRPANNMGHPIQAASTRELTQLGALLHDEWFNAEEIAFDSSAQLVRVPFRDGHILEVHAVTAFEFNESERIQWYDFTRFRYDRERSTLIIETGVPLTVKMRVERLDVRLDRSS